ncbi:MAG: hypothetical protein ACOYMV_05535 [Verrucomicrobiia bacterium]
MKLIVDVPDRLADEARQAGIFERERFSSMLERELVRRKAAGELFGILREVNAVSGKPMAADEVQSEIDAVRSERRARRG